MTLRVLVGSDPEIFLKNPNSGKFVSAEGIVPGDKLNPHKVKKGTISVDGFAAEIGIEPASTAEEFVENHMTVLEELKKYTRGFDHVLQDHVIFDEDVYLGQSDRGRELGCDPDFNAYTRIANPTPVPDPRSLRTASGHIHVGWADGLDITDPNHFMDCIAVAKQMDWYLGVPSLCWGKGSVRRRLYGKAGAFRVKPYGMEYRTPDSSWLKNENRMKLMFENCVAGMKALYKGSHVYNNWDATAVIDRGYASFRKQLESVGIPYLDDEPKKTPEKKAENKKAGRVTAKTLAEYAKKDGEVEVLVNELIPQLRVA